MKAKLVEYAGCFEIELAAETVEEAATMVRFGWFGMNQIKELRASEVYVTGSGTFTSSVVIGKAKQDGCRVPRVRQ